MWTTQYHCSFHHNNHCYHQLHHSQDQVINANTSSNNSLSPISTDSFDEFKVKTTTPEEDLAHLHLTPEKRLILERDTRGQSVCPNWYEARRIRITGSKCGRIIAQKQKTVALLRFCLYPKPMIYLPKPIAWGRENEPNARSKYIQHMRSKGHIGLTVSYSGFVAHLEKCWLGATPDAWINDPSVQDT